MEPGVCKSKPNSTLVSNKTSGEWAGAALHAVFEGIGICIFLLWDSLNTDSVGSDKKTCWKSGLKCQPFKGQIFVLSPVPDGRTGESSGQVEGWNGENLLLPHQFWGKTEAQKFSQSCEQMQDLAYLWCQRGRAGSVLGMKLQGLLHHCCHNSKFSWDQRLLLITEIPPEGINLTLVAARTLGSLLDVVLPFACIEKLIEG